MPRTGSRFGSSVALSALILLAGVIACSVVALSAKRDRQREVQVVGFSATLQEFLDAHAQRNGGQYPSHEVLFEFLVKETGFSNGIYNPFIRQYSEPRSGTLPEPGAIFYCISNDCMSDTLTVFGANSDTITTFVGTHGISTEHVSVKRAQRDAGVFHHTFPHG